MILEQRKDEVLLPHPVGGVDAMGGRLFEQLSDVQGLQFGQMHGG
jgi:hypothetical protein